MCLHVLWRLQGSVGGVDAAIKLFDPRYRGAEEAFTRELRAYMHLRGQQGLLLPRLLQHGVLAHVGAFFLALSHEGEALPEDGPLAPDDRAAMLAAVRGLHGQGVLHGDIRRANFVRRGHGPVKLVDLEMAVIGSSRETMDAEVAQVEAL